jgi:hypothetical protein
MILRRRACPRLRSSPPCLTLLLFWEEIEVYLEELYKGAEDMQPIEKINNHKGRECS